MARDGKRTPRSAVRKSDKPHTATALVVHTVALPPSMLVLERHPDPKKRRALAGYLKHGTVRAACVAARIGRSTWYDWKENDAVFSRLLDGVDEDVTDRLEEAAIHRAASGESDRLLEFTLRTRRRGRYADKELITEVSPGVLHRLRQQLQLLASKPTWDSEELMARFEEIWR